MGISRAGKPIFGGTIQEGAASSSFRSVIGFGPEPESRPGAGSVSAPARTKGDGGSTPDGGAEVLPGRGVEVAVSAGEETLLVGVPGLNILDMIDACDMLKLAFLNRASIFDGVLGVGVGVDAVAGTNRLSNTLCSTLSSSFLSSLSAGMRLRSFGSGSGDSPRCFLDRACVGVVLPLSAVAIAIAATALSPIEIFRRWVRPRVVEEVWSADWRAREDSCNGAAFSKPANATDRERE
jgi:hypothetical protein